MAKPKNRNKNMIPKKKEERKLGYVQKVITYRLENEHQQNLSSLKDMIRSQIKVIISSQPGIEPSVKNRSA